MPPSGDNFGASVALSSDYALIGAIGNDHVDSGLNTASNSGTAYLYELANANNNGTSNEWIDLRNTTGAPNSREDENFGTSVALSETHALIAAREHSDDEDPNNVMTYHATVYLYNLSGGSSAWTNLRTTNNAPPAQSGDNFGSSVALSATHALIGSGKYTYPSPLPTSPGSANAYLYTFNGGTWTSLLDTANAPARQAGDNFSSSVALSATHALVGASEYNSPNTATENLNDVIANTGNAYLATIAPTETAPAFTTGVDESAVLSVLDSNNVEITATDGIYVYGSLALGARTNMLTLNAPTINFQLSTATSEVGSSSNSVVITRSSGSWTSSNLTLPTNGTTYLRTASAGVLAGIASSSQGTITITQTMGDSNFSNSLNSPGLTLELTAMDGGISLGNNDIVLNSITAVAGTGNIIGGTITSGPISLSTITANTISLTASMGSVGTASYRIRVRAVSGSNFNSFLASANANNGNVYLSTNNGAWLAYVAEFGRDRMRGGGVLSIILEGVRKKEPGGWLAFLLDPILSALGSGCEMDDGLAMVVSVGGTLCDAE